MTDGKSRQDGDQAQRGARGLGRQACQAVTEGYRGIQKDTDTRWTTKHGTSLYGYKTHVNVDRQHKLGGTLVRMIGMVRATARIGMKNLACNMRRLTPAALKSGRTAGNTTLQTRAAATLGAPQRRRLTAWAPHAATSFPGEPEPSRIRGARKNLQPRLNPEVFTVCRGQGKTTGTVFLFGTNTPG